MDLSDTKAFAPTGEDRQWARHIYRRFVHRPGSQHIASRRAIAWLAACLRVCRPRHVAELGPGIGTLTELLLTHPTAVQQVVATESDAFCRESLRGNLSCTDDARLQVVETPAELATLGFKADLIVADGGFAGRDADGVVEAGTTPEELGVAQPGTVAFVEGTRTLFRHRLASHVAAMGMRIQFHQFGLPLVPKIKLRISRRFGIPLPVPYCKAKGCWIGVVEMKGEV